MKIKNGVKFGAGNEARTRDLDLGKVALYQHNCASTSDDFINYED